MTKQTLMIWDTSMLCIYLGVPNMDTCAHDDGEIITTADVTQRFTAESAKGTLFVLPLAVIIETGNHISQITGNIIYTIADTFLQLVTDAISGNSPWIIFGDQQNTIFNEITFANMLQEWKQNIQALSLGDITIKYIADFYIMMGRNVLIYTCDSRLRAYSPTHVEMIIPRRKK